MADGPTRRLAPTPLLARLVYSDEMVERLRVARSRPDAKAAMHAVHDELASVLNPKLAALRREGVIIDYATSWLLAELVVHAHADRVLAAQEALEAIPELRDVGTTRRPRRR